VESSEEIVILVIADPDSFMNSNSTSFTRRKLLQGACALLAHSAMARNGSAVDPRVAGAIAQASSTPRNDNVVYGQDTLPSGIRSRIIDHNNGVKMHILEAGFEDRERPCIILLHGFPELAYTWRNQLLPLAQAGFHVIAPDLRGYGRSVNTPVRYDDDILPYSRTNLVSDVVGLVRALGYTKVAAVIGHDWGSPVAAWCALTRPNVFQSVVLVSTPFGVPRKLSLDTADIDRDLAALPRPRKHYSSYWATRGANEDMWRAPQGVHDLLRALYYFKSADWKGNKPFPLKSWSATELAKMPEYYVMDLHKTTAETMAAAMPSQAQIAECKWMSEKDLRVYSAEYLRTGFQGGLDYYRGNLTASAGRTIDVPACYIAGASEWGVYQTPGAFEAMQHGACTRLLGVYLVRGAGHSVVEEQPEQVNRILKDFLHEAQT
jgi:pimeloyl-ACP methyl ester carboxylesterase